MMEPVPPRDLEFVDSHVHFWDPQARRYAWLDGQPSLRRRFGPEDYVVFDAVSKLFGDAGAWPWVGRSSASPWPS
jgi:hypothetical protein